MLYPKDLALIPDVGGCLSRGGLRGRDRIGCSLTMALLRAVGPTGLVVTYEAREDFGHTALTNIERYMGRSPR